MKRWFFSTTLHLKTPRFCLDSKLKYDQDFRLLFYPSIVVDGKHLLTGSRQALDLSYRDGK